MPDIQTNAVDSFVKVKDGTGEGECKIYFKKNKSDKWYREYFEIDSTMYSTNRYKYKSGYKYRDKGPKNCYILKEDLEDYYNDISDEMTDSQRNRSKEILRNMNTKEYFTPDYTFDDQFRPYIGTKDKAIKKLRILCISKETIINVHKDNEGDIRFSLEAGQL